MNAVCNLHRVPYDDSLPGRWCPLL